MRAGCVGRDGRLPPIIASIATVDRLPSNGTVPVNVWWYEVAVSKAR